MRYEAEQTRLVRESAVDFVRRAEPLKAMRSIRGLETGFPERLRAMMGDAGWFGLLAPETLGGSAADYADVAALCEELGKGLVEGPILQEAVLLTGVLAALPPTKLRDELLSRQAQGNLAGALAFGVDSPSADLRCPAFIAIPDGNDFILNGECTRVRVANDPEGFMVGAETPEGPMLGWLSREIVNLEVTKLWLVDGTAACSVRASGVRLPHQMVLAIGDPATRAINEGLDLATVMAAAALFGVGSAAAALTRDYLNTRVQFGKPIGSFQSLAHRAVDQYIQLELAQDALDHAVASLSTTSVGDTARIMAVARAKSRCSDAAIKITRESIQMHGAIGFTDEYDAGLFLKRSLVLSAWLGNGYQHRRRYAELNLKETI